MSDEIDPREEEKLAIDRIARTADGLLLHRYLRRLLEGVTSSSDGGTLQRREGVRTLARDLMANMAAGIEGSSARSDTDQSILRSASGTVTRLGSRAEQRRAAWAAERDAEQRRTPGDDEPA